MILGEGDVEREDYRYHYQTAEGELIRRWDNAPHHPDVETFPHHVHVGDEVIATDPVDHKDVLGEIARRLRAGDTGKI